MQWCSFGTCPVKNASFEIETLNQCLFNYYYISFQDMQSFFEFLALVIIIILLDMHFEMVLNDFVSKKVVKQNIFPLLSKSL